MKQALIFHVDLDAFFASVEQLDHPEWKGKPVIVGAQPGQRGVVSTCSYEARTFGVRSAMPISKAWELCPQGVYTPPNFKRYIQVSRQVMQELGDFSPKVGQASIDEAYLDMTGTERLFGTADQAAGLMKARIKALCGLTVSVGVAPTAYLAKIASDWKKPDGLFVLTASEVDDFLEALPLRKLHGCGEKTRELLLRAGVTTTSHLRRFSVEALERLTSPGLARFLFEACHGVLDYGLEHESKSHSVSAETTFEEDTTDVQVLHDALLALSHEVMFRAREDGWRGRTPHLKLRTQNFVTLTAQLTLADPIASADELFHHARKLLTSKWAGDLPVRLIGIGISGLEKSAPHDQMSLFDDKPRKQGRVEKAILALRKKVPGVKVTKARLLDRDR